MIPDSFWPWPYGNSLSKAASELSMVLDKSALKPYLTGPTGNLAEYLALVAHEWDVNPWWAIISGQREQSLMHKPEATLSELNKWQGYVGLDSGHLALPGYYGVYAQAYRSLSQISWYLNLREDPREGKSTPRFKAGMAIEVMKDGHWIQYVPSGRGEFAELSYTPHLDGYGPKDDQAVTFFNEELAKGFCPKFL